MMHGGVRETTASVQSGSLARCTILLAVSDKHARFAVYMATRAGWFSSLDPGVSQGSDVAALRRDHFAP